MKLDISIPITSINYEKPIRVLFDTIADVLVLYVPNLFVQFVDCGHMHGPSLSFSLSGLNIPNALLNE